MSVLCWVRQFSAIHLQILMLKWPFRKTLNAWLLQHELLLLVGMDKEAANHGEVDKLSGLNESYTPNP